VHAKHPRTDPAPSLNKERIRAPLGPTTALILYVLAWVCTEEMKSLPLLPLPKPPPPPPKRPPAFLSRISWYLAGDPKVNTFRSRLVSEITALACRGRVGGGGAENKAPQRLNIRTYTQTRQRACALL
jgi:hypothetical protein